MKPDAATPPTKAPRVPRIPYSLVWFAVALGLSAWAIVLAGLIVLYVTFWRT